MRCEPVPLAAGTYQCPEDVDGEKCYSECYESDGLQAAVELQVVLGPTQTQPARDGRQRSDEQETDHVTEQRPLLIAGPGVLQPLREGRRRDQPGTGRSTAVRQSWGALACTVRSDSHQPSPKGNQRVSSLGLTTNKGNGRNS